MQTIINKFNDSLAWENLFDFWQNEHILRQEIRRAAAYSEGVFIETSEELNFIKRSLYYGDKKDLFFEILFRNMDRLPVLNHVLEASPEFIRGFLNFLTGYIPNKKPQAREIQFLINIYREELQADFIKVIDSMDDALCAHLLSRTANKNLRKLFNSKRAKKTKENQVQHYGLLDYARANEEYPTIYGDKINILRAAVKSLSSSRSCDLTSSLDRQSTEILLDSTDMLFRAGLLADCLAISSDLVNHRGKEEPTLIMSNEEPYYKQITQMLNKVLPIYSLLVNPADPHRFALDLYRSLFPGFVPDPASLLYLDIHSIIIASIQGHRQYARYEIAQIAGRILNYRPNDLPASLLHQSLDKSIIEDIAALEKIIVQRIPTHPHESYVIMEILRLWHKEGRAALTRISAAELLRRYLQFFYWIPCSLFINEEVLQHLGPLADKDTRNEAERIAAVIKEFPSKVLPDSETLEHKFTDRDNRKLQLQLLLSKYMGVF